ncbi:hypothetical protein Tco_1181007, partial [Tanacetum coccineum]
RNPNLDKASSPLHFSRWIEVATKGLISSLRLNWKVRWCQLECGPRGGFVVCEGCQWSGGHNREDGGIVLLFFGGIWEG